MRCYRRYLLGQKRVWMASGRGNRCLRGLLHYRDLVDEYLAAKREVIAVKELTALAGDGSYSLWTLES